MTPAEIAHMRLSSQQLTDQEFNTVPGLVQHMAALQAQDFAMSKWAIGIRLPGVTEAQVQSAFDKGTILRTHVLRPTWHIVHASDIQWMLELTGPHVKKLMNFTNKALGLTPEMYRKSGKIIEASIAKRGHLTREAIMEVLEANGLDVNSIRPAHYMMQAELDGIVCSGKMQGKQQTYALLAERIPNAISLSREEAAARLANLFFTSHGPATMSDFAWWSGLPMKDVRSALLEVSGNFECITSEGNSYYLKEIPTVCRQETSVYLVPAFDELLISYKDRTAAMALDHQPRAFTKNGIFKPVIVVDGKAVGVWKREVKKDTVYLECVFFESVDAALKEELLRASEAYANFMEKKVVIK